jgi:starch phosphorylase
MRLLVDRARTGMGLCLDAVPAHLQLHQPHADAARRLETWPVDLMGRLLPRHLRIIYDLNARFLAQVHAQFPDDNDLLRRVSLIDERGQRRVRMAYISVLASHKVNGVSALHSKADDRDHFCGFCPVFSRSGFATKPMASRHGAGCHRPTGHWLR